MNEKRSKILFGFFSAFRMWMNTLNVPVTWNALTDTHGSRCALHGRKEISRTIADSNWGTHWTRQFKCRAIDQCALVVEIAQTHRNSRKSIYRNCRSFEQYSKAYIFYLFDFLVLSSICTGSPVMKYDRSHLCARSHNPASNSTSQKHTHTHSHKHTCVNAHEQLAIELRHHQNKVVPILYNVYVGSSCMLHYLTCVHLCDRCTSIHTTMSCDVMSILV